MRNVAERVDGKPMEDVLHARSPSATVQATPVKAATQVCGRSNT